MTQSILTYRDLQAWREAMELATACYHLTARLPRSEQFGLTSQIRRAAVSIPSNIAEGHSRTRPVFLNHLQIAMGSGAEVETQLELAVRLGFVTRTEASPVLEQAALVARLVNGLTRSLALKPKP